MGSSRFFVSIITTAAFVAAQIPTTAFAQNSAQAEVLFKEGQQLISQGKYAEACQRLVASYKLDPQPNTELLEGLCYTKQGKTASAYNAFIDAASSLPKGSAPQTYAAGEATKLESLLLKVRVQFTGPVPAGMAMHFDDETKPRDRDFVGIDIALDPGEHDLFVTANGKHDFAKHFTLSTSNSPESISVVMTDKTKEELAAEHPNNGGGQVIIEKPETSWSTVKTIGMVGIIVGGAAIVAGGVSFILTQVFQANAINLQNRDNGNPSSNICPSLNPTDPTAYDSTCQQAISAHGQALGAQSAALGLLIAGGVIGIGGIVLFLIGGNVTKAPEKKDTPAASLRFTPWFGPQGAGLGLGGTF